MNRIVVLAIIAAVGLIMTVDHYCAITGKLLPSMLETLNECRRHQEATCHVGKVDKSTRWIKLLLIVLWTVLATLSTPRFLLACLHALGYSRAGGLSCVALYLRNWSRRRRYVSFQAFLKRLERYARLGWTIRAGILLMAVGGVSGLCVGVWISGIV